MLKSEREVRRFLQDFLPREDYRATSITMGGRHLHVHVQTRGIHKAAPSTPSDRMWLMAWKTEFKRRWRSAGT